MADSNNKGGKRQGIHSNHSSLSDLREWPACKAANFHFPIKAALTEDS